MIFCSMKSLITHKNLQTALYFGSRCTLQRRLQQRNITTSSSRASPEIFDLVCIGAGTAGLSLIAALRSSPATAHLKLALVERQDVQNIRLFSLPPDQFSSRCSSLTPSSILFLDKVGAWRHVQSERVQAYHEMQVWDGVSDARIEFSWSTAKKERTIAHMTENANIASALLKRIDELGGVRIFENQNIVDIGFGEETENMDLRSWPVLQLSTGNKLAARLLVGADGTKSPVRSFAGIDSHGWDYERVGLVATLKSEEYGTCNNGIKTAFQRFLPTGPVAILPLPGEYSTLVWTTTPKRASHLMGLSPEDFVALVNAAFRLSFVDLSYMHGMKSNQADELSWRLEQTYSDNQRIPQTMVGVQINSIASFPLKLRHADTYIGERVALVGDAAHSIHPLAGQGLNQGQADIESLVKAITYAVKHGQDIGAKTALETYNAERYAANYLLQSVVDKLHKLYSVKQGPLVPLRSIGLKAVNYMELLKQFFMEQAAGTGAMTELDPSQTSRN